MPDVTITEERYTELLRAECVAQMLKRVIADKTKHYFSMSYEEIRIYNEMFNTEVEA